MKFKIGDNIKYIGPVEDEVYSPWSIGIVVRSWEEFPNDIVVVYHPKGSNGPYEANYPENEWELVLDLEEAWFNKLESTHKQ